MKDWKTQLPWLLLSIILICLSCIQTTLFNASFYSAWDEPYFLLKLRDAYNGIITGKSQWDLLSITWFPYLDLTSRISSCWASYILIYCVAINVALMTFLVFGKENVLKLFSLSLLTLLPAVSGSMAIHTGMGWVAGLNYYILQIFLLCSSICAFIIYYFRQNKTIKYTSLFICGILSGLGVFVSIPSASLVLLGYLIIILVNNQTSITERLIDILIGVGGIVVSILYVNFFVTDIRSILSEMIFTSSYISKSGYGYTPIGFVKSIGHFFRDLLFTIPIIIGAFFISKRVSRNQITFGIVYIFLMLFVLYYQDKLTIVPSSLLFLSILIIPFFDNQIKMSELHRTNDMWLYLLLLLFPILGAFGTNTSLSGKMLSYMVAWIILWHILDSKKQISNRFITLVAILVILLPLTFSTFKSLSSRSDIYHFETGSKNISELSLTEQQYDYFCSIDNILQQYDFTTNKSVLFVSILDYCTVYAFDAVLSSNFHQPRNFHYFDKEKMLVPDFIILSEEDITTYGTELSELSWGWPDEFDSYVLGSPETNEVSDMERNLYCRKSKRIKVCSDTIISL